MIRSQDVAPPTLGESINEHLYPRFLHDRPAALRVFHFAVHLTTLRSWYVRRAIRRLEKRIAPGSVVMDVGCGSGDHLFYLLRRRPDLRGIGIDRAEQAVALCRDHASHIGAVNTEFRRADVDAGGTVPPNDLTLCIGMLQYVRRDREMLEAVRRSLAPHGRLLLYVPVHNERIWSFYDRLVEGGMLDYDAVQGRRRVYKPQQVRRLLTSAGFDILTQEASYGTPGKAAFEMHALIVHGLARKSGLVKAVAAIGGLVWLPCMLVLMLADYVVPVSRGNGMLVVAGRAE